MILDSTYSSKTKNHLINDLVGKSYSFFDSFKMKGIGSNKMIIDDASQILNNMI